MNGYHSETTWPMWLTYAFDGYMCRNTLEYSSGTHICKKTDFTFLIDNYLPIWENFWKKAFWEIVLFGNVFNSGIYIIWISRKIILSFKTAAILNLTNQIYSFTDSSKIFYKYQHATNFITIAFMFYISTCYWHLKYSIRSFIIICDCMTCEILWQVCAVYKMSLEHYRPTHRRNIFSGCQNPQYLFEIYKIFSIIITYFITTVCI